MNRRNLIKKIIISSLIALYNIVSLLWCYIISSNFVYNLSEIQHRDSTIGIIGGADFPTWSFIMGGVLGCVFIVLFVLLSLATVVLLTVLIIHKPTNKKYEILLCILSALTFVVYMLIPSQTYAVSLYVLVSKFSILMHIRFIYIIISLIIIATNIFFVFKRNRTQL